MVEIFSAVVVDAEVINYQAESDLTGAVAEEAGGGSFDIAISAEVGSEATTAKFLRV